MITQEIYKSLCNEFNSASFSAKQNSRDTVICFGFNEKRKPRAFFANSTAELSSAIV